MNSIHKLFEKRSSFKQQNFSTIQRDSRKVVFSFEDNTFPATEESLFSVAITDDNIEWRRPKTIIHSDICLLNKENMNRDIWCGEFGVKWVPAAIAGICLWPDFIEKVFPNPNDQELDFTDVPKHFGAVVFHLYFHEENVSVVVDTCLPTKNNQLIYCNAGTEFLPPLLEKALAKLYGSYKALEDLTLEDGLIALTGGLPETVSLTNDSSDMCRVAGLFDRFTYELTQHNLLFVTVPKKTEKSGGDNDNKVEDNGLREGDIYIITCLKLIVLEGYSFSTIFRDSRERIAMVRMRSPSGLRSSIWKGTWSDSSPEFCQLSHADRERIGLTFDSDGDSWMSFQDLCANFTDVLVCRVHNLSLLSLRETWHEYVLHSQWTDWLSGGCLEHSGRVLTNPQFIFEIPEDNIKIDISIYQHGEDADIISSGFIIIKVENNRIYRAHRLDFTTIVTHVPAESKRRNVLCTTMNTGRYVLIPCTQISGQDGEFTVRIYSRAPCKAQELIHDKPPATICFLIFPYPELAVRLTILKAKGLDRSLLSMDPFCLIRCDGQKVRTRTVSENRDPEWCDSFIFYRKNDKDPISIELYAERMLKDTFLGCTQLDKTSAQNPDEVLELPLYSSNKKEKIKLAGKLYVQVFSTSDLLYI